MYLLAERFTKKKFMPQFTLLQNFEKLRQYYSAHLRTGKSFEPETLKSIITKNFIVTPSLIHFKPPTRGRSNRVVRSQFELRENFVRVNFRMDSLEKGLYGIDNNTNGGLLQHVRDLMEKGITMKDKHFTFLHYSNSQMKSHSTWMMNEIPPLLVTEKMISQMG